MIRLETWLNVTNNYLQNGYSFTFRDKQCNIFENDDLFV